MRKHTVPLQSILLGLALTSLLIVGAFSFNKGQSLESKRRATLEQLRQESIARGSLEAMERERRVVEARESTTRYNAVQSEMWSMSIKDFAKMHADSEGVSWRLVDAIITCESGWDYKAHNPSSTSFGLAQFIDSTWASVEREMGYKLDREDPGDQIDAFIFYLKHHGEDAWFASESCWSK